VIVAGLVGFTLGDFVGRNELDFQGIGALFLSLCLEAVASNLEERLLLDLMVQQSEAMALIFGPGAVGAFVIAVMTGEVRSALSKVQMNQRCLGYFAGDSSLGAVGLHFVFFSIKVFGSLQTVLFTSLRKVHGAISMILLTPDLQFTNWHRISIAILGLGLIANLIEQLARGLERPGQKGSPEPFAFLVGEPVSDDFTDDPIVSDTSDTVSM
jgi:hypothetical protein